MTADAYLRQLDSVISRMETLDRRLREIDMMYGGGSLTADMSSERVSHTSNVYKMEDDVIRLSRMKERYTQELLRCTIIKHDIEDLIEAIPNDHSRAVIKHFYVHDGVHRPPTYRDIAAYMEISYSYVMKLRKEGLDFVQEKLDGRK